MAAAWMRAISDLKKRWRGALALTLMLGIAGGIVLGIAMGARRTVTSYRRLLVASKAHDVEIQPTGGPSDEKIIEEVPKLPQVAAHGEITFFPSDPAVPGRKPQPFQWDVGATAFDPNLGRTMDIPTIVAGRSPNYDAAGEAAASTGFMRTHHLRVGDTFSMQTVKFPELIESFGGAKPVPTGPVATVRIVGVWRFPHDVSVREPTGFLYLTPAFRRAYEEQAATLTTLFIRLRHGADDIPAFTRAARKVAGVDALDIVTQQEYIAKVDRVLGVQSTALWILALVVAGATIMVLGQALGRWIAEGASDRETLRALGMSRIARLQVATIPSVAIGLGAAAIAVALSFAAAPLSLFGIAKTLERGHGVLTDMLVLGIGAVAIVALVSARGLIQGAILSRSRAPKNTDQPTLADRLAKRGLSPSMSTGVRFALEPGRGKAAVPVRTVLAGSMIAIAVVTGAFVFGRSMERMLDTPTAYGWNWDLVGNGGDDPEFTAPKERALAASPHVAELSRAWTITVHLDKTDIDTIGVTPIKGNVIPRLLEGTFPNADDEVALASGTMRREHLRVGGITKFNGTAEACGGKAGCKLDYRVVGRIVHWSEDADPDDGAAFTEAGQARVVGSDGFVEFLIRFPEGDDPRVARRAIDETVGGSNLPILPVNLENVTSVRGLPLALAGILAAICLATLLHGLVVCARRRRHDLAILKTLGFVRRQVVSSITWQAATTTVLGLLVGIPSGIVLGRWAWTLQSDRLGVETLHSVAPAWISAGAAGLILLAIVVALWPARIAGRTRPALVLRTE